VSICLNWGVQGLTSRTITTGAAPQELVDMVRQEMDPDDQGKATDGELSGTPKRELS
jgi:hypothetical protein